VGTLRLRGEQPVQLRIGLPHRREDGPPWYGGNGPDRRVSFLDRAALSAKPTLAEIGLDPPLITKNYDPGRVSESHARVISLSHAALLDNFVRWRFPLPARGLGRLFHSSHCCVTLYLFREWRVFLRSTVKRGECRIDGPPG